MDDRRKHHGRPPKGVSLWFTDAKNRTEVVMADGREGVLIGITARSLVAKVRHRNRFHRVPLHTLTRRTR